MADKEYIRTPPRTEFSDLTESAIRYLFEVSEILNEVKTILYDTSYVDNAAAVAGGLSSGDVYYNTTSSTFTKVT